LGDKLGIFIFTNIHAPHIQKSLPLGGQLNKSQKYTRVWMHLRCGGILY